MSLLQCLGLWTCLWIYRCRYDDPTAGADALIIAVAEIWYAARTGLGGFHASTCITCAHLLLLVVIGFYSRAVSRSRPSKDVGSSNIARPLPQPWAKPAVIPGRTNHTRFSPQKHSFSYSYLLVGVPVGWSGRAGVLSIDSGKLGLLSVKSRDYLGRDGTDKSFRERLNEYLRSQGQDPSIFPYAYLVTAPRVLGYSFNPVSFWYLFSSDRRLCAMILEVNNTFDERRLYFLEPSDEAKTSGSMNFTTSWAKDFHVSPFNDRDGSYSLLARDNGLGVSDMITSISNTITLQSPDKQPKLVARLFSTQSPLDADKIGLMDLLRLVKDYGWVGFVTFPRIVREARKLYFRRSLEVFFRPEVAQGSIGRTPTSIERNLEIMFRRFLAARAEEHCEPILVIYKPAPGTSPQQQYAFGKGTTDEHCVVIEILTPAFYSRFVHYQSHDDAFSEEGFCTNVRNRTVHISDQGLLTAILSQKKMICNDDLSDHLPYLEWLRWHLLGMLRCRPGAQSFPNESMNGSVATLQPPRSGPSALDDFASHSTCDGWLYRRNVTQLFLAARLSGGFPGLISLIDHLCRICMVWLTISLALLPDDIPSTKLRSQIVGYITQLILVSSVHGWAMLKGFSAPNTVHKARPS